MLKRSILRTIAVKHWHAVLTKFQFKASEKIREKVIIYEDVASFSTYTNYLSIPFNANILDHFFKGSPRRSKTILNPFHSNKYFKLKLYL